jgi:hypothetical protein
MTSIMVWQTGSNRYVRAIGSCRPSVVINAAVPPNYDVLVCTMIVDVQCWGFNRGPGSQRPHPRHEGPGS